MPRIYADSLGFLDLQGKPPLADPNATLNLVHLTAAPPPPWAKNMAETVSWYRKYLETLTNQRHIRVVRGPRDLKNTNVLNAVLGLQCLPDDADLGVLHHIGVRVVALAYDKPNAFGSGFRNPKGRLTTLGKKALRECAKLGLIIDVSHSGHATARDILECVHKEKLNVAVMASHGGCYSVHSHLRNLPDDVLEFISDLGGVVGITNLTFVLSENLDDLGPFRKHLCHAIDLCGNGAVCIGTDGAHREINIEEWRELSKKMIADFDASGSFQARWPDQPLVLNRADRMHVLAEQLSDILSPRAIEQVIGKNFQSFLEANLRRS